MTDYQRCQEHNKILYTNQEQARRANRRNTQRLHVYECDGTERGFHVSKEASTDTFGRKRSRVGANHYARRAPEPRIERHRARDAEELLSSYFS